MAGPRSGKRPILIVDDDATLARTPSRLVARYHPTLIAHTASEARAALEDSAEIDGAILDIKLPDGSGFDIARLVQTTAPGVPVLMLTGVCEPRFANQAHELGVAFACKGAPDESSTIATFVMHVRLSRKKGGAALPRLPSAVLSELSRRQKEVLLLAMRGLQRSAIAKMQGVSEKTVKTQIAAILAKTGERNLAALCLRLLQDTSS